MPETQVTALAAMRPEGGVEWRPSRYVRPIRRFVEAGALAWIRGLSALPPNFDWVASLELCSLVTGQAASWTICEIRSSACSELSPKPTSATSGIAWRKFATWAAMRRAS